MTITNKTRKMKNETRNVQIKWRECVHQSELLVWFAVERKCPLKKKGRKNNDKMKNGARNVQIKWWECVHQSEYVAGPKWFAVGGNVL
jgi:hypothetical protein